MLNIVKKLLIILALLVLLLPIQAADPSILLAAVGDIMLSRTVAGRITAHGPAWAWEGIAPYLQAADLRVCNLECTLSTRGCAIPKPYSFRVDPEMAVRVLKAGKIDVATLANNHTYDYGRVALADTMTTLAAGKIVAPGAGTGRACAILPHIVKCHRLKLAFVAYTWWTPEGYLPGDDAPALATLDETTLAAELKTAKKNADLLIVSIHWGKEYSPAPHRGPAAGRASRHRCWRRPGHRPPSPRRAAHRAVPWPSHPLQPGQLRL